MVDGASERHVEFYKHNGFTDGVVLKVKTGLHLGSYPENLQ